MYTSGQSWSGFVVAHEITEGRSILCAELVRRFFLLNRDFLTAEKIF